MLLPHLIIRPVVVVRPLVSKLPMEVRVSVVFLALWLFGLACGMPMNVPDAGAMVVLDYHFFRPVVFAAVLQLMLTILLGIASRLGYHSRRTINPFVMVRSFPLVILAVFLYFNFKAWTPLVNPRLYDAQYQYIDQLALPIVNGFMAIRQAIALALPYNVDIWYALLFYAMFFLSLGVHGLLNSESQQRQLVLGLALNLMLGGLSYWIAPAEGPFLYREGANAGVRELQLWMHESYHVVGATGTIPDGYFTTALGAMPSLHVAHSLFFVVWAVRSARGLLILYIPVFLWILIEASATGWHYLVDLPAGALLTAISLVLAARLIPTTKDAFTGEDQDDPAYPGAQLTESIGAPLT